MIYEYNELIEIYKLDKIFIIMIAKGELKNKLLNGSTWKALVCASSRNC